MKKFALLGVGGYVAPRHLQAIATLGHQLVLACDTADSVGVLDSYFPEVPFTTEPSKFFGQLQAWRQTAKAVDYVAIASPNHLHVEQACAAMEAGANVLCEKPLALAVQDLERLRCCEQRTGRRVYTVLQLRLHRQLAAFRRQVRERLRGDKKTRMSGRLEYITHRGPWYFSSWKGDELRSGGIVSNIGVHLFDALIWIFGEVQSQTTRELSIDRARGEVHFQDASIQWFLSLRAEDLPVATRAEGRRVHRELSVDDWSLEFSEGFSELHTDSYRQLLSGKGWGIDEALPALQWIQSIQQFPIELDMPRQPEAKR